MTTNLQQNAINEMAYLLTQYASYGEATYENFLDLLIDECMDDPTISQINEYLLNNGYETYFTYDELLDEVNTMTPEDAFRLGQFAQIDYGADYYTYNGCGNVVSVYKTKILEEHAADTKQWLIDTGNVDSYIESLIDLSDEIIDKCNELIELGY